MPCLPLAHEQPKLRRRRSIWHRPQRGSLLCSWREIQRHHLSRRENFQSQIDSDPFTKGFLLVLSTSPRTITRRSFPFQQLLGFWFRSSQSEELSLRRWVFGVRRENGPFSSRIVQIELSVSNVQHSIFNPYISSRPSTSINVDHQCDSGRKVCTCRPLPRLIA